MTIDPSDFRAPEGKRINLKKWPTRVKPYYSSKANATALLEQHTRRLSDMQSLLYADNRYSLLLILQAMDAAGKDGVIKHVMSGVNPQGCQVYSFKHPSATELEHDFLWRTTRMLPERGHIGIFNRSYYEEVLIVRVHPALLQSEQLPEEALAASDGKAIWKNRYRSIVDLERHLTVNGTRVVKIFLHLSKDEQRRRFLARIDEPEKNWKFSAADIEERKFWKLYMRAYEDCLAATTTDRAPWYIVPADDKPNARLIVSEILVHVMKQLKLSYPDVDPQRRRELQTIRRRLEKETSK
jgi:PPK2 family polyphosphate:nucleotide phosphotransferase